MMNLLKGKLNIFLIPELNIITSRVVFETKKMKIGDPLDRSVQHGPQNHLAHLNKLVEYCETGVREGARLVLGGKRCNRLQHQ